MSKKVLLVGHCGPDSSFLRMAVSSADRGAQILAADDSRELSQVLEQGVDLLLLNREMPYGFEDAEGVGLIDPQVPKQGRYVVGHPLVCYGPVDVGGAAVHFDGSVVNQLTSFFVIVVLAHNISPLEFGIVGACLLVVSLSRGIMLAGLPEYFLNRYHQVHRHIVHVAFSFQKCLVKPICRNS